MERAETGKGGADRPVGGNAPGDGEGRGGGSEREIAAERTARLFGQDVGNGCLEGGAEVGAVLARQAALLRDQAVARAQERGLEAREGQVAAGTVEQRARQGKAGGVAVLRLALNGRPSGLGQAEELCRLVEGLAWRVVNGAADPFEPVRGMDDQELAMPARDEEKEVGKGGCVGQARGQRVAGEVIDADEREAGDERDGLGAHHARQEPADEPGARGRGDAVKVSQTEAGAGKRLFGDEVYTLGMGAGGDVGDDAPEGRMQIGLAPDDRGEDGALTFARADHGGGGLVAA